MNSLKWRITVVYSLLLAFAIAAIGTTIVFRFQAILYEQAQQRVDRVMQQIIATATPAKNPFAFEDPSQFSYQRLINSENIAHWDSASTYIEMDAPNGAVLNKSTYLGSARFPPNLALSTTKRGPLYRTVTLPNGPFLVEDQYLRIDSQQAVVVHVGEPLDALLRTFTQTRQAILFILLVAIVSVVGLSFLLASQITEPINRLARTMRELRADTLDRSHGRIPTNERRHDEIGQLSVSFQELVQRVGEAFARERQFISDASHELKTPLTAINGNAQLLLRWGNRDETIRKESLEAIVRESGELAGMVSGMLTLAKADRGDSIPKEPLSLREVSDEAVRAAAQRASEKGLALKLEAGEENAIILADRGLIRQLLGNLIDNAIKFTESGEVAVRTGVTGDRAWVEVRDTGPGISDEELPRIFERFYRTDKARSRSVPGTGLGLAIASSIAQVHDGTIAVRRRPEGGTIFTVSFRLKQSS